MGERVAMSLYKVLESLTSFSIQSSNLASASDRFILTATINVITFLHTIWFSWDELFGLLPNGSCYAIVNLFFAGEKLWDGHELAESEALAYGGTS